MSAEEPAAFSASRIAEAARVIRGARHLIAFTGAGISVESGIPPFRGPGGLWNTYDPRMLELDSFLAHPEKAWPVIKEIFYDHFGKAKPNDAHLALARLEKQRAAPEGRGRLRCLITQNIDNLHYLAGSRAIVEFHGNSRLLLCLSCGKRVEASPDLLATLPPRCACGGLYKPDFIFFGEGIPPEAHRRSEREAGQSDAILVVGSTGEVYPAALVPRWAKDAGATIIEVNPGESEFTASITDIHIPLKAAEAFRLLEKELAS